jgi:hypothetical protein
MNVILNAGESIGERDGIVDIKTAWRIVTRRS